MAESVDSYVRQLLDNTQYLAAKEKEIKEEERLKAIRAAGGKEGVKAYQSIQRAEEQRAKAAEQQEKYLRDLRLRYNAEQEKAAKKAAADMEAGAFGFSGSDLDDFAAKGASAAAGVAAIGAAATGAVLALNSGAEAILAIDDASRRLTVGRDAILALAQAGEQTGVSFSQIEGLLENLPERITQAARGGNEYAESFERLGVAVTDANGKTRDADGVLRDLLGSLAGLESQTVKAGLAQNLLSDVGLALVQTGALDSKAALDQYLNSVEGSALITDEAVRQARNWRGALSDVGKQAKSVKVEIFNAFGDDAAQIIDNVSLALEFLRTVGFEKLQNKVEEAVGTLTFFWDAVTGDISFKEADERLKALRVELKAEEDAAWDGVKAFYEQRKARRDAAVAAGEAGEATTKLAKSTKDADAAEKERAAALKDEAKWLEHVTKLQDQRRESLDKQLTSLDGIAQTSKEAAASEETRVALEADAARENALALAQEARRYAETASEKEAIERKLQAALQGILDEELAAYEAIEDEKTKVAKEQAEERASAARDGAEALLGVYADAADAIASATAESGGKAAQSAFLASQALGYAQAAIAALKTGGEVAAAVAPVLGPAAIPVGVAAGAAAFTAFAAPIAAQQPPTFSYNDTPGVTQVGPSARAQVDLKEGDLFLAAQSMDGLTAQLGAMLARQSGNTSRRPRRSRLRDRLAINPLELFELDLPRAVRGQGR